MKNVGNFQKRDSEFDATSKTCVLASSNLRKLANRPFYSCVLSVLAFEWKRGWR